MKLFVIVLLGIAVIALNLWFHRAFERFCRDVAAEKQELDQLASPFGGSDGGYNGYRTRLYRGLFRGSADLGLSESLKKREDGLAERVWVVLLVTGAYVGLLAWFFR